MTDFQITDHFSFFEMTKTNNTELQDQNRERALSELVPGYQDQYVKDRLQALAMFMEHVRNCTGPLSVHSAYRCPDLNGATPGSSSVSQHMKGEAMDFTRGSDKSPDDVRALFAMVLSKLIETGLPFGQAILEEFPRNYPMDIWVHLSLGVPFRDILKCGQVLSIVNGVPKLIKQLPIGR